ncbi:hypothetical protein GBA52_009004 [Prunus armeniaca]|nr:hypothetical protein GBA52_009004 [Prunus armeniaca]
MSRHLLGGIGSIRIDVEALTWRKWDYSNSSSMLKKMMEDYEKAKQELAESSGIELDHITVSKQ